MELFTVKEVTVRMPSGELKLARLAEVGGKVAVDMSGYVFPLTCKQIETIKKKVLVIY